MWGSHPLLPPLTAGRTVSPLAVARAQNVLGGSGGSVSDPSSVVSACPKYRKGLRGLRSEPLRFVTGLALSAILPCSFAATPRP